MISPQATAAAQRYLRGVPPDQMMGALGGAISANPTVSLVELITAHKLLTQQQQEQEAERAKQMAMAGAGLPGLMPQQTTVAQQVTDALAASNENLEQEIMASAAQPDREGGIANLNAGGLGRDYANGGIVAFDDGGGVRRFQTAGVVTAQPTETTAGRVFRGIVDRLSNPEAEARFFEQQERYKRELEAGRAMPGIFEPLTAEQRKKSDENVARILTAPPAASTITAEGGPDAAAAAAAAYTGSNAAPAPSTSPLVPRPSGYAAPAVDSGDAAATSAIGDVRRSIAELKTRGTAALDALDKGEIDPATGQPIPKKTFADIVASQNEERKKALTAAGVPEQGHKERIAELVGQASQARNDRDVDRWLVAANTFFAIAGGNSQYALKNMAEGLGVGVKQLQASEKEYRVGEKARLESIATLKQAQRAEELGRIKEATASYEKYQELVQKHRDAKRKSAEHLLTTATQQEQIVATKEARLASTKAISDAS